MAKPVVIGPRSFRTQKSALEHYKALLHRYQDGDRISDPGDHTDLVALVERYDPILDQVGEPAKDCGQIGHFERRLNTGTGWSNSGFWVVRLDGSATDFSYIWAVKGLLGGPVEGFLRRMPGGCRTRSHSGQEACLRGAWRRSWVGCMRTDWRDGQHRRCPSESRLAQLLSHRRWLSGGQGLVK